jgi:hypothetical protein
MVQPGTWVAVAGVPTAGAGADPAQLCGTDIVPTKVARPTPAETPDPPKPDDPTEPIAEPTWPSPTVLTAAGAVAAENNAGLKPPPA